VSKATGRREESSAVDYLRAIGCDAWDVHGDDNGVSGVTPEDIVAWPPSVDPLPRWPDGDDPAMREVQVKYRRDGSGFRKVYKQHAKYDDTDLGTFRRDASEADPGGRSIVYWGRYGVASGSLAAYRHAVEHDEPADLVETDWKLGERVRGWLPDVLMVRQSQKPWVVMWHWSQ